MGNQINPISAITAPFQLFTSAWENERNIEVQRNNNRINREWQSSENALDREFQAQQQESLLNSQQDFQREMYDYQFNKQNEYNLPSNQIARLRAAGLNPAALLGSSGGLAAASGNSSVNVPSVPSAPGAVGSHSVSPSPQIQTPMSSIAQMFSSIAQLQDSVSNAHRQGSEVKKIETLLPKEADKLEAETGVMISQQRLNEATAAVTEFNNMLQNMFGKDEKAAEVSQKMNESYALFAKGQLDEAQTIYTQGLNMLNELEYKIKDAQYPQLIQQAALYNNLLIAQKDTEKAKQADEYASAKEHEAGAGLKEQETRISEAQADLMESTFNEAVAARINELRREGKNTEKLEQEIEMLRKQIDWYDLDKWWSKGESVAKALGVSLGTAIGLGRFKSLRGIKPIKGFSSGVR